MARPKPEFSLDWKRVAADLRITPMLLKWFSRYQVNKGDGQRRRLTCKDGRAPISKAAMDFDRWLSTPWPSKSVPAGISRELERESLGLCVLCRTPTDVPEEAHINRKHVFKDGKITKRYELDHYSQHPHNLLHLCPNCHSRYDRIDAGGVTNAGVRQAKETALAKLLESVDRDVALAEEVKRAAMTNDRLEQLWESLSAAMASDDAVLVRLPGSSQALEGLRLSDEFWLLSSANSVPPNLGTEKAFRRSSIPITANVIGELVDSEGHFTPPSSPNVEWTDVPDEPEYWQCSRGCGEQAEIEAAYCSACEEPNDDASEGYVTHLPGGNFTVSVLMPNPRTKHDLDTYVDLVCERCGNTEFEVEFDTFCSYCDHMWDKLKRD